MNNFFGANDFAAENFAYRLMSKTNSENRQLPAQIFNQLFRNARVARNAGTGRNYYRRKISCRVDGNFIVANDFNRRAQLAKQLIDVVSKRIVVIK